MKTWTLAAASVVALVVACGTESSQRTYEAVSCTLQVPASVDSIRFALQQVADGSLDPCSGALKQPERYVAELTRTDRSEPPDAFLQLIFAMRLRHPGEPLPVRP